MRSECSKTSSTSHIVLEAMKCCICHVRQGKRIAQAQAFCKPEHSRSDCGLSISLGIHARQNLAMRVAHSIIVGQGTTNGPWRFESRAVNVPISNLAPTARPSRLRLTTLHVEKDEPCLEYSWTRSDRHSSHDEQPHIGRQYLFEG